MFVVEHLSFVIAVSCRLELSGTRNGVPLLKKFRSQQERSVCLRVPIRSSTVQTTDTSKSETKVLFETKYRSRRNGITRKYGGGTLPPSVLDFTFVVHLFSEVLSGGSTLHPTTTHDNWTYEFRLLCLPTDLEHGLVSPLLIHFATCNLYPPPPTSDSGVDPSTRNVRLVSQEKLVLETYWPKILGSGGHFSDCLLFIDFFVLLLYKVTFT